MATGIRRKTDPRRQGLLARLAQADRVILARSALIGILTTVVAASAFASTLGGVTKITHPAVAIKFDARQPNALTALAEEQLLRTGIPSAEKLAHNYALEAVRAAPIAPSALRILGFAGAGERRPDAERRLMALSRKLSRRDLGAHLWWIEYYVERGDSARALQGYDLALRTSIPARTLLIPVLYGALASREIQLGLVPYLQAERAWIPELFIYATATGRSASNLVEPLILSGRYPKTAEFSRLARQTMESLLAAGDVGGIQRIYLALPNADQRLLSDARFSKSATQEQYIPVAWDLNGSSTAGAEFEGVTEGRGSDPKLVLRAFVGSGESGIVARKLLFLKPGRYQFISSAAVTVPALQQDAQWLLECTSQFGKRSILTHDLLKKDTISRHISQFEISSECYAQSLQLKIASEGGQSGAEILVDSVSIKKLSY